jgi:hypothetical protein
MKRPTFFEGVAVALGASVLGSALYGALTLVIGGDWALRLIVAVLGLAYLLYLLSLTRHRAGRIATLAFWGFAAGLAWLLGLSLPLYVLVHLGLIWLLRSLYFYSSPLSALTDMGLNGLSLGAAAWAVVQSHSLFLGIWSFFLVQALFVAIPARIGAKSTKNSAQQDEEDAFERAHRAAEAALRRLSLVR